MTMFHHYCYYYFTVLDTGYCYGLLAGLELGYVHRIDLENRFLLLYLQNAVTRGNVCTTILSNKVFNKLQTHFLTSVIKDSLECRKVYVFYSHHIKISILSHMILKFYNTIENWKIQII